VCVCSRHVLTLSVPQNSRIFPGYFEDRSETVAHNRRPLTSRIEGGQAQSWTRVRSISGLGWVGSRKLDPRPTLGQLLFAVRNPGFAQKFDDFLRPSRPIPGHKNLTGKIQKHFQGLSRTHAREPCQEAT